jgi:hypothetical protein
MKYLVSEGVPFELGTLAWRVLVLVKPEPRLDESRVQYAGSVGRLRAWRIDLGTGDMVAVVCVV